MPKKVAPPVVEVAPVGVASPAQPTSCYKWGNFQLKANLPCSTSCFGEIGFGDARCKSRGKCAE